MANQSGRGFAGMDDDKQRDIASNGGQSVPATRQNVIVGDGTIRQNICQILVEDRLFDLPVHGRRKLKREDQFLEPPLKNFSHHHRGLVNSVGSYRIPHAHGSFNLFTRRIRRRDNRLGNCQHRVEIATRTLGFIFPGKATLITRSAARIRFHGRKVNADQGSARHKKARQLEAEVWLLTAEAVGKG
jgi:hypothetical protein